MYHTYHDYSLDRAILRIVCILSFLVFQLPYVHAHMIDPTAVTELITRSNVIATGKIVSIRDSTYVLEVSAVIKGKATHTITLPLLREYVGYDRFDHQKSGQQELVFLTKDTAEMPRNTAKWTLSTDEGQSEVLLFNDSVFLYDVYNNLVIAQKRDLYFRRNFGDFKFGGLGYPLTEMIIAIQDFDVEKYKLSKSIIREIEIFQNRVNDITKHSEFTLTNKYVLDFAAKSPSHNRLIQELIEKDGVLM